MGMDTFAPANCGRSLCASCVRAGAGGVRGRRWFQCGRLGRWWWRIRRLVPAGAAGSVRAILPDEREIRRKRERFEHHRQPHGDKHLLPKHGGE
jgi:hypothetical protein